MRPGSEINRARLRKLGVKFFHGDIRVASDFEALPAVDWVIDAAANPSVLAGVAGRLQQPATVRAQSGQRGECAGILQGASGRPAAAEHQPGLFHPGADVAAAARQTGTRFSLDEAADSARGRLGARHRRRTSPRARPSPCTAAPSWRPKRSRSNMARRSTFRSGSTAAACWPGRGSSARRTKASSPTGLTPTCAAARCATSASTAPASRCATLFHPRDLAALLDAQMSCQRAGAASAFTAPAADARTPFRWRN